MHTIELLETLLRTWGRHFGERRHVDAELAETDHAPDIHPLAIGMRNAPGKRKLFAIQTVNRGRARLLKLGEGAGICDRKGNALPVPEWACDPVHFPETRRAVFGMGEMSRQPPGEFLRVERVALELRQFDMLAGLVVRSEYCRIGTRDEKAAHVQAALGEEVGSRRYREALAMGRGFMYARLC